MTDSTDSLFNLNQKILRSLQKTGISSSSTSRLLRNIQKLPTRALDNRRSTHNPVFLTEQPHHSSVSPLPGLHKSNTVAYLFEEDDKRLKLQRLSESLTRRDVLNSSSSVAEIYSRDISHIRDELKLLERNTAKDSVKQLKNIVGIKTKDKEIFKLPMDLEAVEKMLYDMSEMNKSNEEDYSENTEHMQFMCEIDEFKNKAEQIQQGNTQSVRKEGGLLYKTQSGLVQAQMSSIYPHRDKETQSTRIKRSSSEFTKKPLKIYKDKQAVEDDSTLRTGSDLGAPSNRREAELLNKWLDFMLEKYVHTKHEFTDEQRMRAAQFIYTFCLKEIVRQVSVHCVERGALIERVWNAQVKVCTDQDDTISTELQNLKKKFKHLIAKHKTEYEDKLNSKTKELANIKQELKISRKSIESIKKEYKELSTELVNEKCRATTLQDSVQNLMAELVNLKDKHTTSLLSSSSPTKLPQVITKRSAGTQIDYDYLNIAECVKNLEELAHKKWFVRPKKPILMLGYFDLHGSFHKTRIIEKFKRFGKFHIHDFAEELVNLVSYRNQSSCTSEDQDVHNSVCLPTSVLNYYKNRAILKDCMDDVSIIINQELFNTQTNQRRIAFLKAFNLLKKVQISASDSNKGVQAVGIVCDAHTAMSDNESSECEVFRTSRVTTSYLGTRRNSHVEIRETVYRNRTFRTKPEQDVVKNSDNIHTNTANSLEVPNALNTSKGNNSFFIDRKGETDNRAIGKYSDRNYEDQYRILDKSSIYTSEEELYSDEESYSEEISTLTNQTPSQTVRKPRTHKRKKSPNKSPKQSPNKSPNKSPNRSPKHSPNRSSKKSNKLLKLYSTKSRSSKHRRRSPRRNTKKLSETRKIYTHRIISGVSDLILSTDELKYNLNQLQLRSDIINPENYIEQIQSCNQLISSSTQTLGENIQIVKRIYNHMENYVIEEKMAEYEESSYEEDSDNAEPISDYFKIQQNVLHGKIPSVECDIDIDGDPIENSSSSQTQESSNSEIQARLESFSKNKFRANKEDIISFKLHKKLNKLKKSVWRILQSESNQAIRTDEKLHRRAYKCRIVLDELFSLANIHASSYKSQVFTSASQTDITGSNLFLNRYYNKSTLNNSDPINEDEIHPIDQIRVIFKSKKPENCTLEVSKRIENTAKLYMIAHKKKHQTSTGLKLLIKTMKELCLPHSPNTIHLKPLMKIINRCYIEKAILYKEEPKSFNSNLPDILYDFLLQTFGLKHVTEEKFKRIIVSTIYYVDKSKRIKNFMKFLGIESGYSNEDLNFCLNMNEFINYCSMGLKFSNDETGLIYYVPYNRAQYAAKTFFESKLPVELFKKLTSEILAIKIEETRTYPVGYNYKKIILEKVNLDEFIEIVLKYYKLLKNALHERISETIQRTYKHTSEISEPEVYEILDSIPCKLDLESKIKLFSMYAFTNSDNYRVIRWESFLSMCVDNETIDLLELFRPLNRTEDRENVLSILI